MSGVGSALQATADAKEQATIDGIESSRGAATTNAMTQGASMGT